jgi:hypothetical protein
MRLGLHFPGSERNTEVSIHLMLELLLTYGQYPNASYNGRTEWQEIIDCIDSDASDFPPRQCFDAIRLLLRHGADFDALCRSPYYGDVHIDGIPVRKLLEEWFDADQFAVLEVVVKRRSSEV